MIVPDGLTVVLRLLLVVVVWAMVVRAFPVHPLFEADRAGEATAATAAVVGDPHHPPDEPATPRGGCSTD